MIGWQFILITLVKILAVISGVLTLTTLLTWAERKVSALMQDRIGPNRAGIMGVTAFGVFHAIADAVKLIMKEDFIPGRANRIIFTLAPVLALVPVLTIFAVIPFGNYIRIGTMNVNLQIANMQLGIFFLFAISSLGIYGTFLGGWASRNNFSLLGGLRGAAQMISYEVTLGLTLVGILMIYGSGSLQEMVVKQGQMLWGFIPAWGVVYQFPAFILFMVAAIAENKRTPFDLPEGESEIIGYFLEYSGMRFAMFMFSEFAEIVLIASIATTLFLGGWQIPFLLNDGFHLPGDIMVKLPHFLVAMLQVASFSIKVIFMCWFLLLVRWTLPRFRFDQLMGLCWKGILPLALLNIFITGVIMLIFGEKL
ncbi:MAG TPA: NADH-quinone oxidoreductase subunit NuoH [bacterium]